MFDHTILALAFAIHLSLAQNRDIVKSWGKQFSSHHCPYVYDSDGSGDSKSCSASVGWVESVVIDVPSNADFVQTRRHAFLGYLWQGAQEGARVNISGSWSWRIMDKLNGHSDIWSKSMSVGR